MSELIWVEEPHSKAIFLAWKLKGEEPYTEGKHRLLGAFPQVEVCDKTQLILTACS